MQSDIKKPVQMQIYDKFQQKMAITRGWPSIIYNLHNYIAGTLTSPAADIVFVH